MIFQSKEKCLKKKREKLKNEIAFLDLKLKKEAYKKSLNSGKFSKRIILFCIFFTAIFGMLCLYVQSLTGYETYPLLRIIAAVFGGELLLLLFKRIWSTNDKSIDTFINAFKSKFNKNKKNSYTDVDTTNTQNSSSNNKSNSNISNEIKDTISEINSQLGVG
jgi:hypothetical protein